MLKEATGMPTAPRSRALKALGRQRLPGLGVRAAARVRDIRVRLALDDLDNLEARRLERRDDLGGLEEVEIDRDRLPPPLVEVDRLVTDVKRHEQHPARTEHAEQLSQDGGGLR